MLLPVYAIYYMSDFIKQLRNVIMKGELIFVIYIKALVGFKINCRYSLSL